MKKLKIRALIALVAALVLALSGCGGTGGQASGDTEGTVAVLPAAASYPAGSEWDPATEPNRENGPWAQSFAVLEELSRQAAVLSDVTPARSFSLAVHDPADSGPGQLAQGWADAVAVATGGKVRVRVGFSGSLSGATTSLDDMKQGLIDFVWTLPCYFKGYMPLTNVIQNPSLALRSGSEASEVMWNLFCASPEIREEYTDDGVPLFVCANCTSPLSYKGSAPLTELSQIHGNIRANNGPAQIFVAAAGATPFSCPIGEVYNNVSHGIINFLVTDWNGIDSFALSDPGVLNYYVDTNIGCSAFAMIANREIWDSIDPLLQEGILAASGDYMLNLVGIWDYWEALGRWHAVQNGGTIYTPEFEPELKQLYEETAELWIAAQEDPETARAVYERALGLSGAAD